MLLMFDVCRRPILVRSWFVVAAAFATLLVASGSQSAYGVLLPILEVEFGATRAASSIVMLLYLVAVGLWNVWAGWLTDRFGPKIPICLGYLALVSGLAAWSVSADLLHLYVIHGLLISFGTVFLGLTVLSPIVSKMFRLRSGLALGVASTGFSLGQLVTPPTLAALTDAFGWRAALALSGLGVSAAALFTVAAVWGGCGVDAQSKSSDPVEKPVGKPLRRAVYISSAPYFVCGFTDFLVATHIVAYSTSRGLTLASAALALSLIGAFNIPALVVFGLMADRFGASSMLTAAYAVRFTSFIILLNATSPPLIYLFAAVFGLTYYTTAPLAAKLVASSHGSSRGSTVYGLLVLVHMVGGAAGALFGGVVYDTYLSYQPAFYTSAILLVAAVLTSLYVQSTFKRFQKSATSFVK